MTGLGFQFKSFVMLALMAAAASLPVCGDDDVTFRSDVSLVRVDAQVVDRDNRAIAGLRADDFVLKDEGRVQQISNFAKEDMAVDLLFLLDVSASMRPHVERIANAAHDAFRVMGKDDRIAIMVFDRSTRVRLPFRSNRSDVEKEFDNLLRQESFHGGTDITRGMLDAAAYIKREGRKDARRAIVILTDDETEFERDDARVERALLSANAVMSALIAPDAMRGRYGSRRRGGYGGGGGYPGGGGGGGWPGSGGGMGGPLGGIILGRRNGGGYPGGGGGGNYPGGGSGGHHTSSAGTSDIARESGGDSMPVDSASALEDTISRLRQRYALHFHVPPSAKAGQERTIEVALSDSARRRYPDAEVRFRHVYVAPSGSGGGDAVESPVETRRGSEDQAPVMRRRPAVNDSDGLAGPRVAPGTVAASSAPAEESTASGQSVPSTTTVRRGSDPHSDGGPGPLHGSSTSSDDANQAPKQGGWRKATPEDQK